MTVVAISPKFQIVIPKAVREVLKLAPGQKVNVRVDERSAAVVIEPVPSIQSLRGFLKPIEGVDVADIPNDPEDLPMAPVRSQAP